MNHSTFQHGWHEQDLKRKSEGNLSNNLITKVLSYVFKTRDISGGKKCWGLMKIENLDKKEIGGAFEKRTPCQQLSKHCMGRWKCTYKRMSSAKYGSQRNTVSNQSWKETGFYKRKMIQDKPQSPPWPTSRCKMKLLEWPLQNPDSNIIENVCVDVNMQFRQGVPKIFLRSGKLFKK